MRQLSLWFSWLTLAGFTVVFMIKGNREFLLYAATLSILILLVQWSDRRLQYPVGVMWCFWLWLVMHMCGGFIHLGGVRLYDIQLIPLVGDPYHILRYDQFVHAFCYFMIGGVLKTIVASQAAPGASRRGIALITLLAALGVGAVNEIIEFAAVAGFGSEGVGDYTNNALDNVFNALGAIAALAWSASGESDGRNRIRAPNRIGLSRACRGLTI
jgi:uncharacterized membrane protein YjdF